MIELPTGRATVAGVVGRPITKSLSPLLHTAWIRAAGLDAVYAPFAPEDERAFERLVRAFRGGLIRGFNVTAPYKEQALELATDADDAARRAGSANLLLFDEDGTVRASSTDGAGLSGALAEQAPGLDLAAGPAVVLGAGGAARAAVAALLDAGAPEIRVVNRTQARAGELAHDFGPPVDAYALAEAARAFEGAALLVNAAAGGPIAPVDALPEGAVVMDMTYRPLKTPLLQAAEARGLTPVDGLSMLIKQAEPSFAALYGQAPPPIDVRALAVGAMERQG
jgi:shikimate dehydrogenase